MAASAEMVPKLAVSLMNGWLLTSPRCRRWTPVGDGQRHEEHDDHPLERHQHVVGLQTSLATPANRGGNLATNKASTRLQYELSFPDRVKLTGVVRTG